MRGKILILSGPSGVGKNTILKMLLKKLPNAVQVGTATTRPARPNEIEGQDHYFLSKEDYLKRIESGEILEYNIYDGNYYGTLRQPLEETIALGNIGIMEIDVNGAMNIKKLMPEVITVFLQAESLKNTEQRLRDRGDLSEASIRDRLKTAKTELAVSKQYDHIVTNPEGHPEKAVVEIKELLNV